jgi:hypothetical protein
MNNSTHFLSSSAQPRELQTDGEQHIGGIPWLHGEFGNAMPQAITIMLQIHNKSGIPIIEGQSQLEVGQRQFIFQELRPLGIEAYAHASEAERVQIGQRVWARAAYGKLTII